MKKLLVILSVLFLSANVFAQDATVLKIKRFNAAVSSAIQYKYWTTTPTLKISQTDTTDWFDFSSTTVLDTLLESIVYSNADSLWGTIKVQYGTPNHIVISTGIVDSLTYNTPSATNNFQAKGKQLWFSRPGGAASVRLIIATRASYNQGGYLATPTKTYNAAIVTRSKK